MSTIIASNITVSNLNDGTKTVATTNLTNGSAKGYIHFTTHTNPPSTLNSFNVSSSTSLTDNNTEVEVNLASAMSDEFFVPTGVAGHGTTNPSNRHLAAAVQSSSKIDTEVYTTSNVQIAAFCHLAWFGDLA